ERRDERTHPTALAAPEAADVVAEPVVPLAPGGREGAEPIAAGADVPRLGDECAAREQRVLPDGGEERRVRVEPVVAAGEAGGEVETEAVDPAADHPSAQGVERQPKRDRPVERERVAGAGIVDISRRIVAAKPVIGGVVE